ncbi:asparagine synthase-related protein [Paenibacillus humicola]|uniref:asparagine synthase-related protein n=1 Tax=Paenibacillus humicola TaxID=3110540 RepID=UPI00237B3F27|nr:asparagine synthase-related protein [Paenibacillus humicola]
MSAIAGICHLRYENIDPRLGMSMMKDLERYPADDAQYWHRGAAFLGCRAHWITPQSAQEPMPYYDSERKLAIAADAIIDNREELCDKLLIRREDRNTIPDSVLILLAYERWGSEVPVHLVGDFAFMIWDERNRTLFGARDFSGARTLYFHRSADTFAFCTAIHPLFLLPGAEKRPNDQWLGEFLALPIMADAVDSFATAYDSIGQLPPSHAITVADGKIVFSRYCTLSAGSKLRLKSNGEYEEAFRDVFRTAVKARLRTRLGIGAHLSGGLDSGSVVSFAARELAQENKRLHTFSSYPLDDFTDFTGASRIADERPLIQTTVRHVGGIEDHYFNFPDMSPLSVMDDMLDMLEIPYKFFENAFWMKGIYEQASLLGIGVLLSGQRGNWSVSFGPALDYQARLIRQLRLIRFAREFWHYTKHAYKGKVIRIVGKKAFPSLARLFPANRSHEQPLLIAPHFAERTQVLPRLREKGLDVWGSTLQNTFDVRDDLFRQLYFWNNNGTIGTKLSLHYRLWDRDPTNDLRVVRFCLSVPDDQYVQYGMDRSLIRRSTEGYLPDKIRLNRRSRGIQGADGVHRMLPGWDRFTAELQRMIEDPLAKDYLNTEQLAVSLAVIRKDPRPEFAFDINFRLLMRGLTFYRFMKRAF